MHLYMLWAFLSERCHPSILPSTLTPHIWRISLFLLPLHTKLWTVVHLLPEEKKISQSHAKVVLRGLHTFFDTKVWGPTTIEAAVFLGTLAASEVLRTMEPQGLLFFKLMAVCSLAFFTRGTDNLLTAAHRSYMEVLKHGSYTPSLQSYFIKEQ